MLYIAIGRNVGDEPMYDVLFEKFRRQVADTIEECEYVGQPDTVARGNSRFGDML